MGGVRGILVTSVFSFFAALPASARDVLCYIPGAGGGGDSAMREVPATLSKRGIPTLSFDVGDTGSIQNRARIFTALLMQEIKKDPEFRCHVLAYSMGGVTIRYALNHLRVPDMNQRRNRPVTDFVASVTSFSVPHCGTPLARLGRGLPIGEAEEQLSDDRMIAFNSPAYPETYSPIVEGIPFYSFRTWVDSAWKTPDALKHAGWNLLTDTLRLMGVDDRSDGVVPLQSQGFGQILADIRVPHDYFANGAGLTPGPANVYGWYWHWLHGRVKTPLQPGIEFRKL
jgi:hypothetical protein